MPPNTPISSPNSPYDFILKDPQQQKRSLLPNLPKPAKILLGVVAVMLIIAVVGIIFSGGKTSNSQQLVDIVAKAKEISRVSALAQQDSKDVDTQDLAATIQTALNSEQRQLLSYLARSGVKVSEAQLALYKSTDTDSQLQTAAQNNNLESVYFSYLKKHLDNYQASLSAAVQNAPATPRVILNDAYNSTVVILSTQQIAQS